MTAGRALRRGYTGDFRVHIRYEGPKWVAAARGQVDKGSGW